MRLDLLAAWAPRATSLIQTSDLAGSQGEWGSSPGKPGGIRVVTGVAQSSGHREQQVRIGRIGRLEQGHEAISGYLRVGTLAPVSHDLCGVESDAECVALFRDKARGYQLASGAGGPGQPGDRTEQGRSQRDPEGSHGDEHLAGGLTQSSHQDRDLLFERGGLQLGMAGARGCSLYERHMLHQPLHLPPGQPVGLCPLQVLQSG